MHLVLLPGTGELATISPLVGALAVKSVVFQVAGVRGLVSPDELAPAEGAEEVAAEEPPADVAEGAEEVKSGEGE